MKKAALTLSILCASCAFLFAGPEAIQSSGKDMDKVVQQPVLEMSCFRGFYIGIQGGALLSNFDMNVHADENSVGPDSGSTTPAEDRVNGADEGGAFVGGHLGFNWELGGGHWIIGVETDGNWADLDQSHLATALFNNLGAPGLGDPDIIVRERVQSNASVDWYGTTRLRVGPKLGQRFFLFATGGLAYGGTSLHQRINHFSYRVGEDELDEAESSASDDNTSLGWTAGAGFDYCITHHIILNFTYLYVDLEDSSIHDTLDFLGDDTNGGARHFHDEGHTSSDNSFHVFQGGVSFKF